MGKRKTSAGVIVTDGELFLLGHATGMSHWDIPKGQIDSGEEPIDAAIRELKEETGLVVTTAELVEIGKFEYRKDKDLYLWLWKVDEMPDPFTLDCSSTFIDFKGHERKELDQFEVFVMPTVLELASKSLRQVLTKIDFTKI